MHLIEQPTIPHHPDVLQMVVVKSGSEEIHLAIGRQRKGQWEPVAKFALCSTQKEKCHHDSERPEPRSPRRGNHEWSNHRNIKEIASDERFGRSEARHALITRPR